MCISLLSKEGRGQGSAGGAWQSFEYNEMAAVWIRTADLRHSLSTLFSTSCYSDDLQTTNGTGKENRTGNNSANENKNNNYAIMSKNNVDLGPVNSVTNRWIDSVPQSSISLPVTLSDKQALAARWGNFSLQEILQITRANLENNHSNHNKLNYISQYSDINGNNSNHTHLSENGTSVYSHSHPQCHSSSNDTSGSGNDMTVRDWDALVTSSFLEEKLALSFSIGTSQEVFECLTQWTQCCCEVRPCHISI